MYVRAARNVVSRAHLADERASDVELLPTGFGTSVRVLHADRGAERSVRPETRARAHVPLTNRRDQRRRSAVFALAHEHIWNEGVHRLGTSLSVQTNKQGVVIVKAASEVFSRASFITCPPRRFLRDNFRHRSSRRRPSCRIATPACSSPYRCRTTDARRRGPPPCGVSPRWTVECPPWRP